MFAPVPQCRSSYEISAVDSFHVSVRFGCPSIFPRSTDNFPSFLLFSMHIVSLGLQCLTVRHRRSHFGSSDAKFFELRLLVSVVF